MLASIIMDSSRIEDTHLVQFHLIRLPQPYIAFTNSRYEITFFRRGPFSFSFPTKSWNAVGKHMEADIIQTLMMDLSFINSENERDQCFHACCLLRMEHMPAVPYFMIGRIL
jgi:hypothetical protein